MINTELLQQRAKQSLRAMFIGDSLAMPVHWYYNPMDIFKEFKGGITKFESAPKFHPSSIMSLHSTKQGGRSRLGSTKSRPEVVGNVILKGKEVFWNRPNEHYHQGMNAGQNTLNAHCARATIRGLSSNNGIYDEKMFLENYIGLMTSDPSPHPDTYAESYHRGFFANLQAGKSANKCAAVTHDTASIGGLITISPIVVSERLQGKSLDEVKTLCDRHLRLTHPDDFLSKVCRDYIDLLDALLFRDETENTQEIIAAWAKKSIGIYMPELMQKIHSDNDVVGRLFSSACYIKDSWPSVLYLAYKYAENLESGLLANTNLGGDNVHRGTVLGALLGLIESEPSQSLFENLVDNIEIDSEIDELLTVRPLS